MLRRCVVLALVLACSARRLMRASPSARSRTRCARSRPEHGCASSTSCGTPVARATARAALVRGRTVIALTNGRVPRFRRTKVLAVSAVVPARTAAGAYRVRVCVGSSCRQSRRAVTVTVPVLPARPGCRRRRCRSRSGAGRRHDAAGGADAHGERPRERRADRHDAALPGRRERRRSRSPTATDADVARVDVRHARRRAGSAAPATPRAPFTASYGFSLLSGAPLPLTAVAFDAAGNASAPASAGAWSATAPDLR